MLLSKKGQLTGTRSLLPPRIVPIWFEKKIFVPLPTLRNAQSAQGLASSSIPQRLREEALTFNTSLILSIMAKSKSGGTRSYIRGKIGADVYSVGKDGKGKRQQVVRSLAEQVANPQTEAQMFGRMVMSTVMQAVSAMKPIIDHSFDGIPAGQPSISEFIRRNYALVAADAKAHPASGNAFGLNKYQEKGPKQGAYILSKGNVQVPAAIVLGSNRAEFSVTLTAGAHKVSDLKTAMGHTNGDDYYTVVAVGYGTGDNLEFGFIRFRFNPALADDTDITSSNIASVFLTEGNQTAAVSIDNNVVKAGLTGAQYWSNNGIIISRKNADGWQHSSCTLDAVGLDPEFVANTALPTYPQGSARFLNGGDI